MNKTQNIYTLLKLKSNLYLLILLLFSACGTQRFFTQNSVTLTEDVITIPIDNSLKIPITNVEINGKIYRFIIDTGAPTVISTRIYEELQLKPATKRHVSDSQNQAQKQIFTIIPEMHVAGAKFHNVGCVVIDFLDYVFQCREIDGIIGANQMAPAYWKFDYSQNNIEVAKELYMFDMQDFDYRISFAEMPQKTPKIDLEIFGKTRLLTFDTGYTGSIQISDAPKEIQGFGEDKLVKSFGAKNLGIFGAGNASVNYAFKTGQLKIGNLPVGDEIIDTGNSNLLGNDFLKDYIFIIDWRQKLIYLKKIKESPVSLETFGFGYRFIENRAQVIVVYAIDIPVEIGDIILEINEQSFENLSDADVCELTINKPEAGKKQIEIKIDRNGEILELQLDKVKLLD